VNNRSFKVKIKNTRRDPNPAARIQQEGITDVADRSYVSLFKRAFGKEMNKQGVWKHEARDKKNLYKNMMRCMSKRRVKEGSGAGKLNYRPVYVCGDEGLRQDQSE
jgi:hypothetical protein